MEAWMAYMTLSHAALAVSLTGVLALGACQREQHGPVVEGAPEHMHQALSGDEAAQAWVASCLAKTGQCGMKTDPALACAWRGVRLAAPAASRSLADVEAFDAACADLGPTGAQRAAIAFADLTTRVSHADLEELPVMFARVQAAEVLYPSAAALRTSVNEALTRGGSQALPAYAAPTPAAEGRALVWVACSAQYCLEATAPAFGGGLQGYRLRARADAAPASVAAAAAAGLDAPFMAQRLSQPGTFDRAGMCWTSGPGPDGAYAVQAAPGHCQRTAR
jgi:hypothetical protein